jgi:hypothetical protein
MFRIRSDNMFALPLYVVRTNNWKEKKKQINNIIDYKKIEKKGLHTFGTDRQNDGKSYIKDFVQIFKEEIDDWLDEINQKECLITDIWTVRYKKGEFQSVHNHGTFGYSGVMYLDYVPRLHETTTFVSPFNDPFNGYLSWYSPNNIEEGDILFFPSVVLHHFYPNNSFITRRCIGFDIKFPVKP